MIMMKQHDHDDDDYSQDCFRTNKQSPQNEQLAFGLPNNPPHTTNYPQGLKNVYETDLRGNEVFLPNILTRLCDIFCGRELYCVLQLMIKAGPLFVEMYISTVHVVGLNIYGDWCTTTKTACVESG